MYGPAGQSFTFLFFAGSLVRLLGLHPILFHFGRLVLPTQGVLLAAGLLLALELGSRLAARHGIAGERVWNCGLSSLLVFFGGERLLLIAFHLRDFLAHPLWMLGLTTVRDTRLVAGAAGLALGAAAAYVTAWRLPFRSFLDAATPAAALALAFSALGSLAGGANFGAPTRAPWGLVYTDPRASLATGVPLGVPLEPTALLLFGLYLGVALVCGWIAVRRHAPGQSAALALFVAGLGTVLVDQLRYPQLNELLVLGALTPAQCAGALAVGLAGFLWLTPPPAPQQP